MKFCGACGSLVVPDGEQWRCPKCDHTESRDARPSTLEAGESSGTRGRPTRDGKRSSDGGRSKGRTDLEGLPTTDSGSVRKADAMRWLHGLTTPSDRELRDAITPKPYGFSGSTYPTEISNIRITGDPSFIETFAGLLRPLLNMENGRYRLEINLQRTEDRETGEQTENYALYLSVAERGGQ